MAPNVLFVLTSHDAMGDSGNKTGWYLPEFAHPYNVLKDHVKITIASPNGGEAPLDQGSVEAFKADEEAQNFYKTQEALWKNTQRLSSFIGHAKEFDAIFYVGGHGPMFDLATDPISHKLINEFYESGKVVSAVCHGPAAFVNVKLASGEHLLAGQTVTGFSNTEEDTAGATKYMPFKLEDALNDASGGKFVKAKQDWGPKVVIGHGGRLIMGQNPASAGPVGQAIYNAIFGEETTGEEV